MRSPRQRLPPIARTRDKKLPVPAVPCKTQKRGLEMPGDVALSAVSWSPTPITKAGLRGSPPSPPRPGRSLDVWGGIQERNQDSAFTSKLSAKLMACVTLRSAAVISINDSQAVTLYYNKISTELIIAMDLFAKRLIGPSPARECDVMI